MAYKQCLATETLHRWYRSTIANMVHHKSKSDRALSVFCTLACGVSAPQLVEIAVVRSLRKTHLWDLDKKLIKRFFDSY